VTEICQRTPGPAAGRATRSRLRRMRRRVLTGTTVLVWLIAAVGAVYLHHRIGAGGTITGFADDQPVTLAHLEAGVVREVHVRLHQQIACGQALVSMDDSQERIQLAAIQKDIERLHAQLAAEQARVLADNARAQADVDDLARRFAVDRENARIEYMGELVIDARNRVTLRGKTVDYEITRDLREKGVAAALEFNDIQTEVDALRADVEKRAEVLGRLKEAFDEADRRWAQFVAHADVAVAFEPELTPLRLAADVRARDLEDIVRRIDSHVLRAPIDGQVTSLSAHAGDVVQAGAALATISSGATDRVLAYLPEQMVLSAQVGAPVTVRCLASSGRGDREYAGVIVSLAATVTEAPERYRRVPAYPVWGRQLVVALKNGVRLIPGEGTVVLLSGH
jgi:multidrug resistance efflux pump